MDVRILKSGVVSMVRWFDNSCVHVASTFVGIGEVDVVRRWSVKDNNLFTFVTQKQLRSTMNTWRS